MSKLLIFRVNFIATSHSSLAMVENTEFIEWANLMNSEYVLPSRKKLRDLIMEEFEKLKKEVFSNNLIIF